jgi:hypothetical protein
MGAGLVGGQVTIPSVFISKADCAKIRVYAGTGLSVKFQTPPDNGQPDLVDGSLDNGIVAHEYGHGISNRLTGGPDASSCLRSFTNDGRADSEQMGEGWSDFFSLVLTVEPGDAGPDPRGIGNYAQRNPIDGQGIRAFPYSTDLSVNPVTYYDIYEASIPHGVGHIWCSMLWDMYWQFVDRYGWDEDVIHGDMGNNIAIQLVMDGMKIQPCSPGFVDGRDAILMADMMNNNGDNQDIIWKAFARRGLGQFADQGGSNRVADGKEDYTVPPQYIKSVKFHKAMTPNINKGENIVVTLSIRNDLDEVANNIEIIDLVPLGASIDLSALPSTAVVNGDQITFDIAALDAGTSTEIVYELETPPVPSKLLYFDNFEDPESDGGTWSTISVTGNRTFNWVDDDAFSGTHSYKIANTGDDQEQVVFSFTEIQPSGSQPMVRFAHKYDTDSGNDGGVFEISQDYLVTVEDLGPYMIREGYNNNMRRATFPDIRLSAFSGQSEDWVQTYVDLAAYNGTLPLFQFRFGSDDHVGSSYWTIDDFTLFDALTYNSEACLNYDGSTDMICAEAPEWGTIVEPEEFSSTIEVIEEEKLIHIYPNPADEMVTIEILGSVTNAELLVRDMSGRLMNTQVLDRREASQRVVIRTESWSAGMYIIEIQNAQEVIAKKFFKK